MTIREITQEIPQLSVEERLSLLSLIAESLRQEIKLPKKESIDHATPITDRLTGIVQLGSTDDGILEDDYAESLEKKYRSINLMQ